MASITERAGKFFVRVRRDGFPTVSKTFTKKNDATAWARRTESDMEGGRWVSPATTTARTVPTMREALALYRSSSHALSLKGAKTYAYWFDELAEWSEAGKPVDAVTAFDVARWRDEQALRLTASTVVRKLGLLAGFFSWCVKDQGIVTANPVHSVRKPRANDARERTMDDEEQEWLMKAARSSRAHWLPDTITVLLRSAMRRGELFSLTRADVDFDARTAHLSDTKNGSDRDVPLCPQALESLRRLASRAEARGVEALLPVSDPAAISLAFRRTVKRAQTAYQADCAANKTAPALSFLDNFRLHDLRHQAVTHWASIGGLSLVELQAVSGHKSVRMLGRYTHLKASSLAEKMAAISA